MSVVWVVVLVLLLPHQHSLWCGAANTKTQTNSWSISESAKDASATHSMTLSDEPTISMSPSREDSPSLTSSRESTVTASPTSSSSPSVTTSPASSGSLSRSISNTESPSLTEASESGQPTQTESTSNLATLTRTKFTSPIISRTSLSRSISFSSTPQASTTPSQSESGSLSQTITPPPTPSPSHSFSITVSLTPSAEPTQTSSGSLTQSETVSDEPSGTRSPTFSKSLTSEVTTSPTVSLSPSTTRSPTYTWSVSPVVSDTSSITVSESPSVTGEPTVTPTPNQTLTPTASTSDEPTASVTPNITATPSPTASDEPSQTGSPSTTVSPSVPVSFTESVSVSPTNSSSPSQTVSDEVTATPSTSISVSPTISGSPTFSVSGDPTLTTTQIVTPTHSVTVSATPSYSITPELSSTGSLSTTHSFTLSVSASSSVSRSATSSFTISASLTGGSETAVGTESRDVTLTKSRGTPTSSVTSSASPDPSPSNTITTSQTADESISRSATISSSSSWSTSMSCSSTWTESDEMSRTGSESFSWSRSSSSEQTVTSTLILSESDSRSTTTSSTVTLTETRSYSDTISMPLTTSPMPPTTTPVPTPTFTLPTRCPTDCANGVCQQATQFVGQYVFYCNCFASTSNGYWSGAERGGPCDKCAAGYYGLRCLSVCPGGACSICNGHGRCSDGLFGDGTCTCYNDNSLGFWSGVSCNRCQSGYFGGSCVQRCTCEEHGTCSEGTTGDGSCACQAGWKGLTCGKCDETVNALCESLKTCPGADGNCNGHGACNFTFSDSGFCDCYPFYALEDCSKQCLNNCSGHGECSAGRLGTGLCTCDSHYLAPSCASCMYGRFNSSYGCRDICPGGELTPCSNNGTCMDDGKCICRGVSGGKACNMACPVAPWNASLVCSGHGTCTDTVQCTCNQDSVRGYWDGAACQQCDVFHGGADCTVACPVGPAGGRPCGIDTGDGFCNQTSGVCVCSSNKCGKFCNVDKVNGVCAKCVNSTNETVLYGFDCKGVCACDHGACSDGVAGDGSCLCERGWSGQYCNITCPGGLTTPCSDQGSCDQLSSSCICDGGFAGPVCNISCLRNEAGAICNGTGQCFDGAAGNGSCLCDPNYVWPETGCTSRCDCSGHGKCHFPSLTCVCDDRFNGSKCERCQPGLHGSQRCDKTCVAGQGVTDGYNCSCFDGFAGPNCSIVCPFSANGICDRHGTCDKATGLCRCDSTWVGPGCTCNEAACKNVNVYTRCDSTIGQCICISTRTGAKCENCVFGFYGAPSNGVSCTTRCDCNDNGPCDINTGVCNCFQDPTLGYWTGGTCNQCVTGYMGTKCNQLSSAITQTTDLSRRVSTLYNQFYATLDVQDRFLYVGGAGFQARFNVATIVSGAPETNTLHSTVYNKLIYGSIAVLEPNITNRSQLLFILQKNASETKDPQVYSADAFPFLTSVVNISDNALATATNELAGELSFVFMRQDLKRVCGMPGGQLFYRLYCKTLGEDVDNAVKYTLDMTVQSGLNSPSQNIMIFGGSTTVLGKTICTITGFNFFAEVSDPLVNVQGFIESSNLTSCSSLTAMYEADGVLFFAAQTPTSYIGAYNFTSRKYLRGQVVGGTSVCRAITYNTDADIGYAVFADLMVKFELVPRPGGQTPQVNAYGQLYTTSRLISRFIQDDALQIVYAPLASALGIQVLRYSLVEVASILPSYADRRGGALITITGKGFRNISSARCIFDKDSVPIHQYINKTTIICVAPEKVSSAVCLSQPLEISMNGIPTTNNLEIQRPASVIIVNVDPSYVRVGEVGRKVTISGRSFSSSPFAVCEFVDPRDLHVFTTPAIFSETEFTYSCEAPTVSVPWSAQTYLRISLDGFVYSDTTVPFLFVGQPVGIEFGSQYTTVSSPHSTLSPAPIVYSVDLNSNRLLTIDTEVRNATILPPSDGRSWIVLNNVSRSRDGTADLSGFALVNPRFGVFVFRAVMGSWVSNFTVVISPGAVAILVVKTQPQASSADIVVPGSAMPKQVDILALDAGGNEAGSAAGNRASVSIVPFIDHKILANETQLLASVLFTASGSAGVGALVVTPTFGKPYVLFFAYEPNPLINVTTNVFYAGCPSTHYFVNGTQECVLCNADRFLCDGSDLLVAKEENWRSSDAAVFFYPCPIEGACLFGGECAEGYEGPTCGVCASDYGKDFTGKCGSCPYRAVSIVIFTLVVLFQFSFLLFVSVALIQNWQALNSLFVQSVITMSIAFGHFQMMSIIGNLDLSWTPVLRNVTSFLGMLFGFELHRIRAVNCLLNSNGIDAVWFAIIYSLIVVCTIPFLAFVVHVILRWFPTVLLTSYAMNIRSVIASNSDALAKAKLVKRARNSDGTPYVKEHQRKAILANVAQVVITFCFQTSCRSALQLFQCTEIRYSATEVKTFLTADLTVSCDTSSYQSILGYSSFLVFAYVIFIPLLFIFGVAYSRKRHSEDDFRLYTSFTTIGIKDLAFYWNGLLFFRKAALIACDLFLTTPIQGWMAMWLITLTAWLEHYSHPWILGKHMNIERAGFMCHVFLTNCALVLPQVSNPASIKAMEILLMAAIAALIAFTLYAGLYKSFRELQGRIKERSMREDDGDHEQDIGLGDVILNEAGAVTTVLKGMLDQLKDKAKTTATNAINTGFSVMPTRGGSAVKAEEDENDEGPDVGRSPNAQPPIVLRRASIRSSGSASREPQSRAVQKKPAPSKRNNAAAFQDFDDIENLSDGTRDDSDDSDEEGLKPPHGMIGRGSLMSSFRMDRVDRESVDDTKSLDPSKLRRMELEREIDEFIVGKGFGIYQQDPGANSLFDTRESPVGSPKKIRRPAVLETLMRRQGTLPKALQDIVGETSSEDSDQRSVDSDL